MNKILRAKTIIASSVAVITFLVFLPSLRNEFVNWDDNNYVYNNPFIRSFDAQLWKSAFAGFYEANWHPLTWLSHAADYAVWGLNPLGHHLTNNILHALNALLVVFLVTGLLEVLRKTAEKNGLPRPFINDRTIMITGAATGVLFGLHPLHVESVAWVTERKDLLCAFFFLLAIISYTRYASEIDASAPGNFPSRFSNRKYLLALGFFILSLLSKPMAVTLPLVLLILDWYFFRRIRDLKTARAAAAEKLPFFALALVSSVLTIAAQNEGGAVISTGEIPLASRVIVAAGSLAAYLVKIVVPLDLVPFYPYPEEAALFSGGRGMLLVLALGITAACIAVVRDRKSWMAAWSYYVITLLPVLGIVQVGSQSMADRYAYLPSLGPLFVIGFLAAEAYEKASALSRWRVTARIAWYGIAMAVLVSLSSASIKQIGIWKNSIVLWNYVLEKEPSVALAHNNLADAYLSAGQPDGAIEQTLIALRLKPNDAGALNNLGAAYLAKGAFDAAMEQYRAALRLDPDSAVVHGNLGYAYLSRGQVEMAIEEFRTGLRLRPDDAEAYNNLGNAYVSSGRPDLAIEQYQAALRLKPDVAEVHYNLGNAYVSNGLFDPAIEQYRDALRLKPDFPRAHLKLGRSYLGKGSGDLARAEFELELALKPDDYEARQALDSLTSR